MYWRAVACHAWSLASSLLPVWQQQLLQVRLCPRVRHSSVSPSTQDGPSQDHEAPPCTRLAPSQHACHASPYHSFPHTELRDKGLHTPTALLRLGYLSCTPCPDKGPVLKVPQPQDSPKCTSALPLMFNLRNPKTSPSNRKSPPASFPHLLEVRELCDLHAVQPHLPPQSPRTQHRALPVVLNKPAQSNVGQTWSNVLNASACCGRAWSDLPLAVLVLCASCVCGWLQVHAWCSQRTRHLVVGVAAGQRKEGGAWHVQL